MKVFVEFTCSNCGAIGEGFRDESEVGEAEDCWQCGKQTYYGETCDEEDCDE